ncbi:major facilitator superfamily domain-containing protein [Aspergillus stella-maris]|uniref:major facilitator superfamily domain-containing protein n=1 Tax=Aspergillus stella-maris TaxID=1810926 RepID=UPI003CCDBE79
MGVFKKGDSVGTEAIDYVAIVRQWTDEERAEKERKFVRKIDVRLLPILARVQGLEKDLNLSDYEYNIVLSLTFVGYILMQIPSNMLLSLTRPSVYLSLSMVAWGIASGVTGAVQNFSDLTACRFLLGVTEAPFFAGSIFYSAAMLSGAFGGLFAAGIEAAFQNKRIASWQWLFIIEGAATVVFAVITGFTIPDWPATTRWLTPEERAISVARIEEDTGTENDEITTWSATKSAVSDHRIWLYVLGSVCVQALASLTNFLPTLVASFGYGTIETLLLTAPPYVLTAGLCILNSYISDRASARSSSMLVPCFIATAGIIITVSTTNTAARYVAIFMMLPGTYGTIQISNAWMSDIAARPRKKRAIALAMNNAVGNSALVWTPYLYPESQGPRYVVAWSVNLALEAVCIASIILLRVLLVRDNRRLAEAEIDGESDVADDKIGVSEKERVGHVDMTEIGGSGAGIRARHRYQI